MTRILGLILILVAGCGNDEGGGGGDVDGGVTPPLDGVPASAVRFQRDVVPILNRSCGTGTEGCHDRKMYGANRNFDCRGWLALENAPLGAKFYGGPQLGQNTGCPDRTLYQRLVEIAPWQCADTSKYARAGDLRSSYLIDKVRGTNLCSVDGGAALSKKMPPSDSNFVIAPGDIETLEAWVMAGAKDD